MLSAASERGLWLLFSPIFAVCAVCAVDFPLLKKNCRAFFVDLGCVHGRCSVPFLQFVQFVQFVQLDSLAGKFLRGVFDGG